MVTKTATNLSLALAVIRQVVRAEIDAKRDDERKRTKRGFSHVTILKRNMASLVYNEILAIRFSLQSTSLFTENMAYHANR